MMNLSTDCTDLHRLFDGKGVRVWLTTPPPYVGTGKRLLGDCAARRGRLFRAANGM